MYVRRQPFRRVQIFFSTGRQIRREQTKTGYHHVRRYVHTVVSFIASVKNLFTLELHSSDKYWQCCRNNVGASVSKCVLGTCVRTLYMYDHFLKQQLLFYGQIPVYTDVRSAFVYTTRNNLWLSSKILDDKEAPPSDWLDEVEKCSCVSSTTCKKRVERST